MNRKWLIGSIIMSIIIGHGACDIKGVEYFQPETLATHFNGEKYVGSQTCSECHADIHKSHELTAHFNTSALVNSDNIQGSFDKGANMISLDDGQVEMVNERGAYYQHVIPDKEGAIPVQQQMDIVIGSGIKGQTFVTWEDDKLYQLQASYYPPEDKWINSPGYPDQIMRRPIRDGCLKCHVTFATNKDFSGQGNRYDPNKIIYGIGCEKCHRPSENHVVFHRANPEVASSKFMLKLDTLSRQHRLDVCAQCHSGPRAGILKGNSFSYLSGERLDEYSRNFYSGQDASELDVHGNQHGLLTSSQCFIKSPEMDCSTCHNPHMNQRADTDYFNSKCATCHSTATVLCSAVSSELEAMGHNCISCHMPTVPSKAMAVDLGADREHTGVLVRTHLIGIHNGAKSDNSIPLDPSSRDHIIGFIETH